MRIETDLAKASLTRVDQRDPYKVTHKMKVADLTSARATISTGRPTSPPARFHRSRS